MFENNKIALDNIEEKEDGIYFNLVKDKINYPVFVTKTPTGTSMTDYYKFGDLLTYNEFIELEEAMNLLSDFVSKNK